MHRRKPTKLDTQSTGILSAQSRARWGAKPIAITETVEPETRCVGKTVGNRITDRNRNAGITGQREQRADVKGDFHEVATYAPGDCGAQFTPATPGNGSRLCPDGHRPAGHEGELAEIEGAS